MPARDPSERAILARIGGYEKWAQTSDRTAATAPARNAFMERFERQVDPDGTLEPDERAKRAECAKKAYFAKLALKSAQSRRRAAEATAAAESAEQELSELDGAA